MNSREIIRAFEAAGWFKVGVTGNHHHFKHPSIPGRVTVPHPKKDIPIGTLRGIETQSQTKLR